MGKEIIAPIRVMFNGSRVCL